MYVGALGNDDPIKIMNYHVTWLASVNKAVTYLLSVNGEDFAY